jgi:hypothetical protein
MVIQLFDLIIELGLVLLTIIIDQSINMGHVIPSDKDHSIVVRRYWLCSYDVDMDTYNSIVIDIHR